MNEVVVIPKELSEWQAWSRKLAITTQEQRSQAIAIIKEAKTRAADAIEKTEASVKTAYAAWKAACALRDSVTGPLKEIETCIKAAVNRYDAEQERIRLAEQARLQALADEQARKERDRLEKAAERLKTPELKEARLAEAASIVAPVVAVPVAQKQEGESKQKAWKFRIIDPALIPRDYWMIDEKKIGDVVRATKGSSPIAGIEIYSEDILKVRVK